MGILLEEYNSILLAQEQVSKRLLNFKKHIGCLQVTYADLCADFKSNVSE